MINIERFPIFLHHLDDQTTDGKFHKVTIIEEELQILFLPKHFNAVIRVFHHEMRQGRVNHYAVQVNKYTYEESMEEAHH